MADYNFRPTWDPQSILPNPVERSRGGGGGGGISAISTLMRLGPEIEGMKLRNEAQKMDIDAAKQRMSIESTLGQRLGTLRDEFVQAEGNEGRTAWLNRNIDLNAVPIGNAAWEAAFKMTEKLSQAEFRTLGEEVKRRMILDNSELVSTYGANPTNQETFRDARIKRTYDKTILPFVTKENRTLTDVPDDVFFADGSWNPIKGAPWLNKLPLAPVHEFAPPEIGRLADLRDRAKAVGNVADAEMYQTAIDNNLGRYELTARSRAHTELATTVRQQMRSIDDSTLKPAEKESQKAVLMNQLENSRRVLLGVVEGGAPTAEGTARANALIRIDKEIADLEVDFAKNPKQGTLDIGKDNRSVRMEELKQQRERLNGLAPPAAPASVTPSRPAGATDADLLREAAEARAQGRDPAMIRRRLDAWGVNGDF